MTLASTALAASVTRGQLAAALTLAAVTTGLLGPPVVGLLVLHHRLHLPWRAGPWVIVGIATGTVLLVLVGTAYVVAPFTFR
jgi:hypothetical protein